MAIVGKNFDSGYTTNVPYTATRGTVTCSGKFYQYTEKEVEKIKYEVSAFLVQAFAISHFFTFVPPKSYFTGNIDLTHPGPETLGPPKLSKILLGH